MSGALLLLGASRLRTYRACFNGSLVAQLCNRTDAQQHAQGGPAHSRCVSVSAASSQFSKVLVANTDLLQPATACRLARGFERCVNALAACTSLCCFGNSAHLPGTITIYNSESSYFQFEYK